MASHTWISEQIVSGRATLWNNVAAGFLLSKGEFRERLCSQPIVSYARAKVNVVQREEWNSHQSDWAAPGPVPPPSVWSDPRWSSWSCRHLCSVSGSKPAELCSRKQDRSFFSPRGSFVFFPLCLQAFSVSHRCSSDSLYTVLDISLV